MNPYDFVPSDFNRSPDENRRRPLRHHRFHGISGTLSAIITAETPIFVKRGNSQEFMRNGQYQYIIPGTSLKGLFRSLVETTANGCFGGKFDGEYRDKIRGKIDYSFKLPREFKACIDPDRLCIACRIFGMLSGKKVFTGKVSFQDAICEKPVLHEVINTVDLMGPKPHHGAFYLDGNRIAGRKFYFHHPRGVRKKRDHTAYNQRITPLDKASEFTFTASFANLEDDEWRALLYAIALEPDMRHKIGYAKPSGLGSVRIGIEHIRLIDYARRYTQPNRGVNEMRGSELTRYTSDQIQFFTENTASPALSALRRIWRWDPKDTTLYRYPDEQWFRNNPDVPIHNTP